MRTSRLVPRERCVPAGAGRFVGREHRLFLRVIVEPVGQGTVCDVCVLPAGKKATLRLPNLIPKKMGVQDQRASSGFPMSRE